MHCDPSGQEISICEMERYSISKMFPLVVFATTSSNWIIIFESYSNNEKKLFIYFDSTEMQHCIVYCSGCLQPIIKQQIVTNLWFLLLFLTAQLTMSNIKVIRSCWTDCLSVYVHIVGYKHTQCIVQGSISKRTHLGIKFTLRGNKVKAETRR